MLIAIVFGGGGSGAGFFNLAVQAASLAVLAINFDLVARFAGRAPRPAVALIVLSALFPLLQCIPLPPAVWQALPGRALVHDSLQLVGEQDSWRAFSVVSQRTLVAFFSLVPPFALIVLTWDLPGEERRKFLAAIVGGAIFVTLLGAQQLALDNRHLMLFSETVGSRDLQGTFANRNSAGLFLDAALCALVALLPFGRRKPMHMWAAAGIAALLLVGLVLTRSRSSMALVIVPMLFLALRMWKSGLFARLRGRFAILALVGVAVVAAAAIGLVADNRRVQVSLGRFDELQDARPLIWSDAVGSVSRFWPLGSGIGTFDEVFQIDESLENLGPGRAARAHNDYLEVALESGVPGLALVAAWAVLLGLLAWRAVRRGGDVVVAVPVLGLFAIQSILDYPLRNQTLLCVAGLMIALMLGSHVRQGDRRGPREADLRN